MSSTLPRLALVLTLLFCVSASTTSAAPIERPYVPGEFIIKFTPGTSDNVKTLILSDLHAEHIRGFGRIKSALKRLDGLTVEQAIEMYRNHPNVEFIEPNYILEADEVPDDTRYPELWGMNNTGQTGGTAGADISAENAWDVFTGNPNIVVGVIDTGVDYNHVDLADNIWTNPGEIPGNGIDDDGNGYVDDIHGWDFVNNDSDPMDDNGHGTHCSGTIGGVGNNGVGVTGVNWNVRIMALKFLNSSGSGSTADAVSALEYATDMALRYPGTVRLTSNSWGGGGYSQAMYDAIADAGAADMLFIAAAGNSSSNTDVSPHYPSAYDLDNIVAVAATDHNDELASFSSYGATSVDLAAPGVDILSTTPGNSYSLFSGTSMATPHVSGVAALTFGRFPAVSALDAKALILNGADPLANLDGVVLTGARLNAFWPIAEPDSIAPDPVTDLVATQSGSNWIDVSWTATGDDESVGDASRYDMRYSTSPITDLNFDGASMATGEPDPGSPGTLESMRVSGLDFTTNYYVALKVLDEFGNASLISNVVNATTLEAPDISSTPLSLSEALLTGGTSSQSLQLQNLTGGTLDFVIPTPTLLGEPTIANTYVQIPKGGVDTRASEPTTEDTGGPDNFGYRWADSNDPFGPTFDWVDISGMGTTALSTGDDASAGPFPIGFDFPFYDAQFSEFNVCSNGFISLTSDAADYGNQPLPSPGAPAHLIAPFWDDLDVGSGNIYYYNDGTRLIVQWDAVGHYSSGGPYTFQAILYPDGVIEYQYLDMGLPNDSATVGWQNGDGTDGLNVVFNNAYVENNLAVRIKAIPQWVTVTPTSGTVFGPGSTDLQVDFDAAGLFGGTYDGFIRILSNDPDESEYEVPVQLVVTGAPDITVDPLSYDFGSHFVGGSGETDIVIRNSGTDDLEVNSISIPAGAFAGDVTGPFTLAPRQSQAVHVTFTPTLAQSYSTAMTITSADPDEPVIVVDLSGAGLEPPEFAIDPTSLSADLYTGDTETQTLTLTNSGGADFEWSLSVNLDAEVTVYETEDLPKGVEDTNPGILGSGGPDNYGYSWMDSDEPGGPAFDWVDITGVGTSVYSGNADDVNSGPFPIGFDFPFYENSFSTFRVSSNGFITFTSTSSDLSNAPLPGTGAPENLLALLHDDMYVDADIPSQVYYYNDGSRLIVQFHDLRRYGQSDTAAPFYDMEAILYPNGRIVYQYLTVESGGNDGATIGIQNATQDDGLTVVYNEAYVHDNMAIRFDAAPEWFTASPTSGTIPPGGSATVTGTFNAAELFGGTYTGDVNLVTNDPSVPTLDIPLTLHVTGAPQIEVSATEIDFGSQFVGYPAPRNLVIANGGTDDLTISSAVISTPEFVSNLTPPVTLGPTQSLLVDLSFLPTSATTFSGTLTIESNDPSAATTVIDLLGEGLVAPQAAITPTSISADLFTGESEAQTLTLTNSGGSDLEFSVSSRLSVASVPVYNPDEVGKDEDYGLPGILGSGGPDVFGYSWIDSDEPGGPTFNWIDISATGTPLFTSYSDDGNRGPNPIGFTFPFYGNDFTEFRVCSNGWISFTSTSTDYSNAPLPGTGAPENLLAVFHDDLKVDPTNGSQVYYQFDGEKLIVQFDNVPRLGSGGPYTFEAFLYPTGTIRYQYLSMEGTRLDEATIGIQNATQDDGLNVVYDADYVHDGLAIRLGTIPDWLSSNPTDGVVPPGGSANILTTFDASGLFGGGYDGAVRIQTNDPAAGLISVSAHLDVTGIPLIAVDPTSLDFGSVYLTQDNTLPLTVSNPGTQTLHVSGIAIDDPEFTADMTAFDVEPLQAQVVNVTFAAVTAGTHEAVLSITHDADGSPTEVGLTAVGVVPPVMVIDPTSIEAAAMPGGQKVKTITVCNEGGSDLSFTVGESQDASSTQVYTEVMGPKQTDEEGSQEVLDTRPSILGSGGPDTFGYTWIDSDDPGGPAFNWVDITTVGTPVPFGSYQDDGNVGPVPIGFDFPFYGETFSELHACSNGWLSFTNDTLHSYSNQPLPNSGSSVPENLLAPWWDDMVYDESDGNYAYYYNDGSRFIITYYVRRIAAYTPPFYEFQVILYPNGNIVYQYNQLGTTVNSSTIGMQNGTKDGGLTVAFDAASYAHDGLAILFSAAPDWMSMSPESGVVPAGECMELTVTFDASELEVGDHTGTITLTSNDINEPVVDMPVVLHVGTIDATYVDVDPNTLNLASNGKYMTAFVELPEGYDPNDVLVETITLNGVVPAATQAFSTTGDFNGNGIPDVQVKFDRGAAAAILPAGEHVPIVITGEVRDTTWFVATDSIRVINPTMGAPVGGEMLVGGAPFTITWTNPAEWSVDHADLFWTSDDGVTWTEVALDVQGESFAWNVPMNVATEDARIRVLVYDNHGMLGFDTSAEKFVISPTATDAPPSARPRAFALSQNSPNPFNPRTVIRFDLPEDAMVKIAVYDSRSRLVKTLLSRPMPYGTHEVIWEGKDNRGNQVATGVYFYRITAGSFEAAKRMVLVK